MTRRLFPCCGREVASAEASANAHDASLGALRRALSQEQGELAQSEERRSQLVLLLDNIVAECEATKTRIARLAPEQRRVREDAWVVTKL